VSEDVPVTAPRRLVVDADVVRAHQHAVWRWLRVLGCRPHEADDLAQETFVVLLRTQLADDGPAALRAWLRSTAKNLFLAHCRRAARAPGIADDADVEAAFAAYERDDDGAGYRAALRGCLETLPARQRELLELHVHERATPQALAAATGLADEGARSLLRRIKQALRQCIERRLHDDHQ
jgi:RNA polymerase sigma-70 factor (ECF subfamily)